MGTTGFHLGRIRKPCSAFARAIPCRTVCCAERASPFPTMRRLRIRRTCRLAFGAAARRALQGERCGFPGLFRSSKAHSPIPSPSGGGCRPQGRQERENVTGPRCENDRNRGGMQRFNRLQAVRFSLFRHPPRGGSADATFPRWGKEGGLRIRRTWELVFGVTARRANPGAPYDELPRIRPNTFMWERCCQSCHRAPTP